MSDSEKKLFDGIEEAKTENEISYDADADDFLIDEIEDLIHVQDVTTDSMPVIPLRGISIFPTMLLHFDIGREKSVRALEAAMMSNQLVFLVTQRDPETDLPTQEDFYDIGVTARIKQMLRLPGNAIRVLVEGISRGRIEMLLHDFPYFRAEIESIPEDMSQVDKVKSSALMRTVLAQFSEYPCHR